MQTQTERKQESDKVRKREKDKKGQRKKERGKEGQAKRKIELRTLERQKGSEIDEKQKY